jgi:hypothetical protein
MNSEASIKEELAKVTAEISKLKRCKKVLEDTIAYKFYRN